MNNSITLTGIYKGINKRKLLLKINTNNKDKIIAFKISKGLEKQILSFVKTNSQIGIRGHIEFTHTIVLVATKIFILNNI